MAAGKFTTTPSPIEVVEKVNAVIDDVGGKVAKADAITGLSVSGKTITYTKGNGTTGTITTQDTNTDTKVTNTLATTTKAYVTGTTSATTTTGSLVFDTGIYLDATAGTLVAKTFKTSTGIEIY